MARADSGLGRGLFAQNRRNGSVSARDLNQIIRALTMAHGVGNTTVRWTGTGLEVNAGDSFPWTRVALGYKLTSATKCKIYAGSLRIHGVGTYPIVETEHTLDGAVAWVFVKHARDHSSTILDSTTTEPETTSTELQIPLYRFVRSSKGKYAISRVCNVGDINLDTPVR